MTGPFSFGNADLYSTAAVISSSLSVRTLSLSFHPMRVRIDYCPLTKPMDYNEILERP